MIRQEVDLQENARPYLPQVKAKHEMRRVIAMTEEGLPPPRFGKAIQEEKMVFT
jgi:hypothetical protein